MNDQKRRVLLTGKAGGILLQLHGPLQRFAFEIEQLGTTGLAVGRISSTHFDVVIVDGSDADDTIHRLATAMRAAGSASSASGLIVLAPAERVRDLSRLVGRGVNKVMSTRESPEVIALVANRLGSTRHSLAERFPIQQDIRCLFDGTWHPWRTENVSASGMLLRTDRDLALGTRFRFRLDSGGGAVEGEAKVVRCTDAGREGLRGIGVRFTLLEGDGRRRLADLLRSASTSPSGRR